MRWRDMLNLVTFDMCVTVLALGYGIGRIGCQVSGDGDYGIASKLPWAMGYPHGTVPTPPGVTVQPTPIYETVAMCLLAYFLWQLRDRVRPGVILGLYLVFSGLERLLVEFVRRNKEILWGLTAPQLESIVLMVIGVVLLAVMARQGGWTLPGGGVSREGCPACARVHCMKYAFKQKAPARGAPLLRNTQPPRSGCRSQDLKRRRGPSPYGRLLGGWRLRAKFRPR